MLWGDGESAEAVGSSMFISRNPGTARGMRSRSCCSPSSAVPKRERSRDGDGTPALRDNKEPSARIGAQQVGDGCAGKLLRDALPRLGIYLQPTACLKPKRPQAPNENLPKPTHRPVQNALPAARTACAHPHAAGPDSPLHRGCCSPTAPLWAAPGSFKSCSCRVLLR